MDKGKSTAASSQGTEESGKELRGEIHSDGDDERGRGEAAAARAPRGVDKRASSSAAGAGGGASSSSAARPSTTLSIAPFEDGQYVRLRNRGRGGYLYASEIGRSLSVDHRRGMVNTAWAVQILRTAGTARVLLRSAYGRYLCPTIRFAGFGLVGCHTTQGVFEFLDDGGIGWTTVTGKRGSVVLVQITEAGIGALRANGRYLRWNTTVTYAPVDLNRVSSMMEWEVQVIPLTLERPPYQPRLPNAGARWSDDCEEVIDVAYSRGWFGDNGIIEHDMWTQMRFRGRNLTRLRQEIAHRLGVQFQKVTLFAQGGYYAEPIPLLTDLHIKDDPRMIVAFMDDSPGFSAVRFPDLAAE